MTNEEIDQMPAGVEMNLLIGERLFGYTRLAESNKSLLLQWLKWQNPHCQPSLDLVFRDKEGEFIYGDRWSEDVRAAWQVVERMRADGWLFQFVDVYEIPEWSAGFYAPDCPDAGAMDSSAPLAICRAALKAKLGEVKQ